MSSTCRDCGKTFGSCAAAQQHRRDAHLKSQRKFKCTTCTRRFSSERARAQHFEAVHELQDTSQSCSDEDHDHDDIDAWQPHPFPGEITNVGAWRAGYASLWFRNGKIKIIPEECGRLMTVVDSDGRSRTPYSRGKKGKPKHISRLWLSEGLGMPSPVPDGFHDVPLADHGSVKIFDKIRILRDGIELRTESGMISSLRCEFTKRDAPPVQIAIMECDVHDDKCSMCSNFAPKRCVEHCCRRHCTSGACAAHS